MTLYSSEVHTVKLKDGETYNVLVSGALLEDENGTSLGTSENEFMVTEEGEVEEVEHNRLLRPSVLLKLENANIFHLSVKQITILAIVVGVLLGLLFLVFILSVFRSKKLHKAKGGVITFTEHGLGALLFLIIEEVGANYLSNWPVIQIISGLLAAACLAHLCFRAIYSHWHRLGLMALAALVVSMGADIAMTLKHPRPAATLLIVSYAILAVAFILEEKPEKTHAAVWVGLSMVAGLVLYKLCGGFSTDFVVLLLLSMVEIAAFVAAAAFHPAVCAGVVALVVPSVLKLWEQYMGRSSALHIIAMLVNLLVLVIISGVVWHKKQKKQKTEKAQAAEKAETAWIDDEPDT